MLIGSAHCRDRAHTANGQKIEGRIFEDAANRRRRCVLIFLQQGWRRFLDEPGHWKGDDDYQDAESSQCAVPTHSLCQPVGKQGHDRASDADAEIGESHRLAAGLVEPARHDDLIRQRAATDIAERVDEIEKIEHPERRHRTQSDERDSRHQNS